MGNEHGLVCYPPKLWNAFLDQDILGSKRSGQGMWSNILVPNIQQLLGNPKAMSQSLLEGVSVVMFRKILLLYNLFKE